VTSPVAGGHPSSLAATCPAVLVLYAWLCACLWACLWACTPVRDDFSDGVLVLPSELREVSAIAALDERTLVCLQDETGALFFVDLLARRPPRLVSFGEPGDYEGLARVGDDFWVLRSDGFLLRLRAREGRLEVASSHRLPTEHQDWEGLCFDAERRALLALPKDRIGEGKEERDERFVYAIDPLTGAMEPQPVLVLSVRSLVEEARADGIELPTKTSAKGKTRTVLELLGSEILAVPGTDELLLLSATDRALLRIDRAGRLLALRTFEASELPKPEGMAWLPDGRLLIASEGDGGPGVVRVVPLP
jgi:SdiA-regulated protein